MDKKRVIEIIVPCYNEEQCIALFYEAVERLFSENLTQYEYSILYVDDGSKDNTLSEIKRVVERADGRVKYVSFSRNFGKEAALYVGFQKSTGDYVVPMDADLQHPPELLIEMAAALEEGYDCAAAKRVSRKGESKIRSAFARVFYRVMKRITGLNLVQGSTDFRMMKRNVVEAILQLQERERFTKGIYAWMGFRTKWIGYENVERAAGSTKWKFGSLMNYAINGFFSFTKTPLRGAVALGGIIMFGAFVYGIWTVVNILLHPGWLTGQEAVILILLLFGGIIICILGIIGEYLAKIYMEIKGRPIYLIRETNIEKRDGIE